MSNGISKSAQINIAAFILTPIAVTILLYVFAVFLDLSPLSWKPYPENIGTHTFAEVLLGVVAGHVELIRK